MSEYIASISVTQDEKEVVSAPSHSALIEKLERRESEITKEINQIWILSISPASIILVGWGVMSSAYIADDYVAVFLLLMAMHFILLACEWIVYKSSRGSNFALKSHLLPTLYARRRKWRDELARQNNPDSRSSSS